MRDLAAQEIPPNPPLAKGGEDGGTDLRPVEESPTENRKPKTGNHDFDAIVNDWFLAHFPNSPIERHDASWLLLHRAVADLKQRLKGA